MQDVTLRKPRTSRKTLGPVQWLLQVSTGLENSLLTTAELPFKLIYEKLSSSMMITMRVTTKILSMFNFLKNGLKTIKKVRYSS